MPLQFRSPNPSRASPFGHSRPALHRFEEAIASLYNLLQSAQAPKIFWMAPDLGFRISIRCYYGDILPSLVRLVASSPHYSTSTQRASHCDCVFGRHERVVPRLFAR